MRRMLVTEKTLSLLTVSCIIVLFINNILCQLLRVQLDISDISEDLPYAIFFCRWQASKFCVSEELKNIKSKWGWTPVTGLMGLVHLFSSINSDSPLLIKSKVTHAWSDRYYLQQRLSGMYMVYYNAGNYVMAPREGSRERTNSTYLIHHFK